MYRQYFYPHSTGALYTGKFHVCTNAHARTRNVHERVIINVYVLSLPDLLVHSHSLLSLHPFHLLKQCTLYTYMYVDTLKPRPVHRTHTCIIMHIYTCYLIVPPPPYNLCIHSYTSYSTHCTSAQICSLSLPIYVGHDPAHHSYPVC